MRRLYLSRSTPPCSSSAWSRTNTAMTMPRTLGRPARRLLVRALCRCTAEARWWLRAALCAPAAPMCTAGARLESGIRCSLCRGSSLCTGSRARPELQLGHDLLVRSCGRPGLEITRNAGLTLGPWSPQPCMLGSGCARPYGQLVLRCVDCAVHQYRRQATPRVTAQNMHRPRACRPAASAGQRLR